MLLIRQLIQIDDRFELGIAISNDGDLAKPTIQKHFTGLDTVRRFCKPAASSHDFKQEVYELAAIEGLIANVLGETFRASAWIGGWTPWLPLIWR